MWEDPSWFIRTEKMIVAQTVGGNDEANANLIAAAPDLLAALEQIATLTYGPENLTSVRVRKLARAAIAKATGGDK